MRHRGALQGRECRLQFIGETAVIILALDKAAQASSTFHTAAKHTDSRLSPLAMPRQRAGAIVTVSFH